MVLLTAQESGRQIMGCFLYDSANLPLSLK